MRLGGNYRARLLCFRLPLSNHCSSVEPLAAARIGHLDFPHDFFHSHFLRRKWKRREREMAFPGLLMDVGVFMERHRPIVPGTRQRAVSRPVPPLPLLTSWQPPHPLRATDLLSRCSALVFATTFSLFFYFPSISLPHSHSLSVIHLSVHLILNPSSHPCAHSFTLNHQSLY